MRRKIRTGRWKKTEGEKSATAFRSGPGSNLEPHGETVANHAASVDALVSCSGGVVECDHWHWYGAGH